MFESPLAYLLNLDTALLSKITFDSKRKLLSFQLNSKQESLDSLLKGYNRLLFYLFYYTSLCVLYQSFVRIAKVLKSRFGEDEDIKCNVGAAPNLGLLTHFILKSDGRRELKQIT